MFIRSKNVDPDSDRELVLKYRNSHELKYAGELFERYTHLIFGVGLKYLKDREDAKDMVMELFEKLLSELKKHDVQNFKSWIYTVAKNYCLMKIRKKEPRIEFTGEEKEYSNQLMENQVEEHLHNEDDGEELWEKLEKGIKDLNKEQQKCIELFYFQDKAYQEITEITGYSLKQVKTYLQNGKRNLRNIMDGKNG